MNITLNGKTETLRGAPTLADLIASMGKDPTGRGLAVAVNGEVVPRSRWPSQRVSDADRIELLEAVQGG